jgi:hypothetical protein
MYLAIKAAVTFNGNSNVMKSNCKDKCTIYGGKSIYSQNAILKFSVCEPGTTNTPATYDNIKKIEIDLDKCGVSITCTTIDNKAPAATVTCTSTTDSQLVGDCATGYWKDTTGTADACKPHTVCGNQLTGSAIRLSGNSKTAAGTCNSCATNTYATNDQANCLANTACGNLATGVTRSSGASRTAAGFCKPCAANTFATNDATNCAANKICGNLAAGGTRLTGASRTVIGTCKQCDVDTYAPDGTADCLANTACGTQTDGDSRLTGADRENAGTCNPCAIKTFAKDDVTNCAANTICGNQAAGGNRLTGADRKKAGTCTPCVTTTWDANGQKNCVAHTVCGKQVGSSVARITTAGSPTTDTQCQACRPGTWGTATEDCQNCAAGTYNSDPVHLVCQNNCNAGSYILQDKSNCLKCPYGQFQNQNHQSSCIKCSKGKISKEEEQISISVCTDCIAGQYNPYEGNDGSCLPCAPAKKGATECPGCGPGKYRHDKIDGDTDGDDICNVCALGLYTDEREKDECKICPTGYFTNDQKSPDDVVRSNRCQECPRGTYGDQLKQERKDQCKACDAGRFNDAEGIAKKEDEEACTACVAGTYSTKKGNEKDSNCENCDSGKWSPTEAAASVVACTDCGIGRFSTKVGVAVKASCLPCDLGSEQKEKGKAYCLPCTPGKFGELKDGINTCSSCPENTFTDVSEQKAYCLNCANGRFSGVGAVSCSLCPVGHHIDGVGCTPCTKGMYQPETEQATCLDCGKGKVSINNGASMCDLCQNGYHQTQTGQSTCQICNVGKFKKIQEYDGDNIDYECLVCVNGQTSVQGSAVCSTCGTGKIVDNFICTECEKGKIAQAGDLDCKSCGVGLYQPNNGTGSCKPCDAGTWSDTVGSSSEFNCNKCNQGMYSTAKGASNINTCNSCPPGSKSQVQGAANSNVCESCVVGRVAKSGAAVCTQCPSGRTSSAGASACSTCSTGHMQVGNDSDTFTCEECQEGSVAQPGDLECLLCFAGLFQTERGQGVCLPCDAGTWSDTVGSASSSSCNKCNQGMYSTAKGASNINTCNSCPPGSKSQVQGAANSNVCESCVEGRVAKSGAAVCTQCPSGRTSPSGASACSTCSTGHMQVGNDSDTFTCEECQEGSVAQAGDLECLLCFAGLFQTERGHGTCQACDAGTWSDTVGSSSSFNCTKCKYGTYSTAAGAPLISTCNACPPGTKSQVQGAPNSKVCERCEMGKVSKAGASICTNCLRGQFTLATGESSCSKCIVGRYGIDVTVADTANGCVKCPVGWKRSEDNIDLSKCVQCELGETTSREGSTSCSFCSIGRYGSMPGNCTHCPKETYQSDKGKITCNTCLDGETPNEQATGCEKAQHRVAADCDFNSQYLNNSSPNKEDHECQLCPLGGYCVGNNITWKDVRPKYGWWRLHETKENTHNHPPTCLNTEANQKKALPICIFQKCLYPHACHGKPNPERYILKTTKDGINKLYDPANETSNFTETCDETKGYSNNCKDQNGDPSRCRLCATCIGGSGDVRYKRSGSGAQCKLCPSPKMNRILLAVGCLVMLIGSAGLIYMEITSETSEDETSDAIKKIIGK